MKIGILHDIKLEEQFCVTFCKKHDNTEGLSFGCYPTKHDALLAISLFQHRDIFKELATK